MKMNPYETEHADIVRHLAAECTVLLKRDGKFPLPSAGKIALYGSGARRTVKGGTGSGEVNSRYFISVEEGLKKAGFEITTNPWLDTWDEIVMTARKSFIKEMAGGDIFMPGCKGDVKNIMTALNIGTLSRRQLKENSTRLYRMAKKLTEAKHG